ncbi:polysaccharide deacetylase family protein [Methylocapsa acidiphila]|uniref:polysaccharide deacetylase family protein n=1 Tax=Methylocapsa acidiphila TaxID=133552 RepID=UPI00047D6BAB|nr:polysaccharide deacetylase family protein [Methylocapsa acidiphila]
MATKILLKRALGPTLGRTLNTAARLQPGARRRKLILLYHSVGGGPWATPEAAFRRQMSWLADHAKIVSLPQLLEDRLDHPFQAAVTFDDGYASLRDKALPILRDVGATASVFLNTGCLADQSRNPSDLALGHYPQEFFLSWRDIETLASEAWTIGAHGVDHIDLSAASAASIEAQLCGSKAAIESRIGPAEFFAYPWGRHNEATRRAAKQAGYRFALSCDHGPVGQGFDPWAAPRVNIANDYSLSDFAAVATGDWDYLGWVHKWGRRK